MRNYDRFREYPCNYDRGHAVVVSAFPDNGWMEANLTKRPLWRKSGTTGEDYYVGDFVGWKSSWLGRDASEGFIICFEDRENHARVVDTFPEIVIEANPFGPDLCPKCSGLAYPEPPAPPIPSPAASQGGYLSRVFKALIGVQ